MKDDKQELWYAPLEAQFQLIEGAMPIKRFAAIEAVLHLFMRNAPKGDPARAYLLFTQYQLIGATQCTPMDHILQRTRLQLGYYRSQKYWQDDLRQYREKRYDAVRAFTVTETDDGLTLAKAEETYPYAYAKREKEWARFWTDQPPEPRVPHRVVAGTYRYTYPNLETGEAEPVSIRFEKDAEPPAIPSASEKGSREPITISVEELLQAAKEMAERSKAERSRADPCYTILRTNVLKEINGSSVQPSSTFTIQQVVNVVGMVGAGKSTLIKVLAFWFHKNGHRMAIVVDTVAEVLHLQQYLAALGVTASPLIGRSERLKYINQVTQPGDTCLSRSFSQYLAPVCLIDGMDEQHSGAIAFGKEPCYTLRKGSKHYLCPYFAQCSGTKMLRDCYTASVVITTVAGFAASRVGPSRETFLELAIRELDLVVFDESDRVQKALDQFFMPETSFDNYISESAEDCSAYMRLSSKRREENLALQRYDEMQRQSVTVSACLSKALHHDLGSWRRITYGDPFSALTLLDDLYQTESEYQIPKIVYQSLYDLIDMPDEERLRKTTLWIALDNSCKSGEDETFGQLYNRWLEELGPRFPRPKKEKAQQIQDARIKLILRLIYFDHFIRNLSDAYEACHETSYGQNELFGFLQTRFRQQQAFLPSALCGNLFGLKKTDDEDIVLFRQFAFGRSLMKDLPYLHTDAQGQPAGPHVILLSGSSWAEGSYQYHINRPVNYLLEAEPENARSWKRLAFLNPAFPSASLAPGRRTALHNCAS